MPTPEGAAYYPYGSWGPGYILDEPTQARMDLYLRRMIWIMMPIWPLSSHVGRSYGADEFVSGFGGWIVFCFIHTGVILFILRDSKRTTARVTSEELLRLALERRGPLAVEASYLCLVIISLAITAGVGVTLQGWERWAFGAAGSLMVVVALRQLSRIKRLDAARRPYAGSTRP